MYIHKSVKLSLSLYIYIFIFIFIFSSLTLLLGAGITTRLVEEVVDAARLANIAGRVVRADVSALFFSACVTTRLVEEVIHAALLARRGAGRVVRTDQERSRRCGRRCCYRRTSRRSTGLGPKSPEVSSGFTLTKVC